jgi:hypothetical protein
MASGSGTDAPPAAPPPNLDEPGSPSAPRRAGDIRRHRSPVAVALGLSLAALYLGLVGSFFASAYHYYVHHRPVRLDAQQYDAYLTGFAFGSRHLRPSAGSDSDFCDAAAHRLNGVAGDRPFFSEGCQDAQGRTYGDPPLRPRTLEDLNNPDD